MTPNLRPTRLLWLMLALTALVASLSGAGMVLHATEQPLPTVALLTAVTTGSAVADNSTMSRCRESAIYLTWSTGTSAGAVTIESSDDATFAGTWAPEVVLNWDAANVKHIIQITGVHLNLRTRVSTTVVGGTVTTKLVCN